MNEKCWHHPRKDATYIINLGTKINLDSPVCDKCAMAVIADTNQSDPVNPNAKVTMIKREEVNQ